MRLYGHRMKNWKIVFVSLGICTAIPFAGWFSSALAGEAGMVVGVDEENSIADNDNMSGEQMSAWVTEQTGLSRAVLDKVQAMLEAARAEKDTIKITCLDDKVTQIHVSYRGVEERTESMEMAISGGDMVSSRQIFSILRIYFSRIHGLSSEAENCLGESDVVLGKTETSINISGDITVEDPSEEDISDDFGVDQPAHMSGYL